MISDTKKMGIKAKCNRMWSVMKRSVMVSSIELPILVLFIRGRMLDSNCVVWSVLNLPHFRRYSLLVRYMV